MNADSLDLRLRTKRFALQIIRLYANLPKTTEAQVLGKQVLRSGTAVGAHYREAFRSRSSAEFVSKIDTALQELEETIYWIELLTETKLIREDFAQKYLTEADELIRILVASSKTAKHNSKK